MSVVDGLSFSEEKKKYILEVLDPVLEEMVADTLTTMPASPTEHMVAWLRLRSGVPVASKENMSLQKRNEELKRALNQTKESVKEGGSMIKKEEQKEEESEEEEDDEMDELPEHMLRSEGGDKKRASVSAEAYGAWNKKVEFVPPVHAKTDEQKARLEGVLTNSFMFNQLSRNDLDVLLLATQEAVFEAGATILQEGDDGDCLFVIEKGSPICKKLIDGENKVVKTCAVGDVFGELALLYNAPRAATVEAGDNTCVTWKLDRDTFNAIVKDASQARLAKYDDFLKSVTLLSGMGNYERTQIAEVLKEESFRQGEVIVRQNDPGDKFYIVEDGSLKATKEVDGVEKTVLEYKAGDYFGELALLKNQPRAASVLAVSDCKVLTLDRKTFNKMLGPLQDLLNEKSTTYA